MRLYASAQPANIRVTRRRSVPLRPSSSISSYELSMNSALDRLTAIDKGVVHISYSSS